MVPVSSFQHSRWNPLWGGVLLWGWCPKSFCRRSRPSRAIECSKRVRLPYSGSHNKRPPSDRRGGSVGTCLWRHRGGRKFEGGPTTRWGVRLLGSCFLMCVFSMFLNVFKYVLFRFILHMFIIISFMCCLVVSVCICLCFGWVLFLFDIYIYIFVVVCFQSCLFISYCCYCACACLVDFCMRYIFWVFLYALKKQMS